MRSGRRLLRNRHNPQKLNIESSLREDVMSSRHCCDCSNGHTSLHPAVPLTPAGAARSRAALLAGASLVVLAALGAPGAARAACVPSQQTINRPTAGPILSNGGGISVTPS